MNLYNWTAVLRDTGKRVEAASEGAGQDLALGGRLERRAGGWRHRPVAGAKWRRVDGEEVAVILAAFRFTATLRSRKRLPLP